MFCNFFKIPHTTNSFSLEVKTACTHQVEPNEDSDSEIRQGAGRESQIKAIPFMRITDMWWPFVQ
jgi:hypothetical protein